MGKLLLLLSFISLIILIVGSVVAPGSQLFLLSSSNSTYQIVREVLAGILFLQLITHPPRHIVFRLLSGLVALLVGSWALVSTYNGMMSFLDTFSLLASASAIGVTALEVRPAKERPSRAKSGNPLIA